MRTRLSILNGIVGILSRVIVLLTAFIVRSIFTRYLSEDVLGLEGLYANVVSLFSLVDLGIGTAISFSLYKPLHEKDYGMVGAIMKLYKKVYMLIGCIIIVLSSIVSLFIPYMVKDTSLTYDFIRITFLIYSVGVAITYFLSYKRTLIHAMQKNYIVLLVDSVIKLVSSILQIIFIIRYKNYILYLVVIVVSNFLANFIVSSICNRMHLYDKHDIKQLSSNYTSKLKRDVKALAVTNVCGMMITSTDNIIISAVVGVIDLAKNSNYSLIINALKSIVMSFLDGPRASIGDLIVEGDNKKINDFFNKYCFIYYLAASFCSLGLFFISKSFISLWVGEKFVFSNIITIILSLNLYIILTMQPISMFQNLGGLYTIYQPISIKAAIVNLVTSIILGYFLGLIGVFIGTTCSYIYQIIMFSKLLHEKLLISNFGTYLKTQGSYMLVTILIFIILYIVNLISFDSQFITLAFNSISFIVVYFLIIYVRFRKDDNMNYFVSVITKKVR